MAGSLESCTPKQIGQIAKGAAKFGILSTVGSDMAGFQPVLYFFSQESGMKDLAICTRARQEHHKVDGVALAFTGNLEECSHTVALMQDIARQYKVALPCRQSKNQVYVDITGLTQDLPKFSKVVKGMAHKASRRAFLDNAGMTLVLGTSAAVLTADGVIRFQEVEDILAKGGVTESEKGTLIRHKKGALLEIGGAAAVASVAAYTGLRTADISSSPEKYAIADEMQDVPALLDRGFRNELTQILNPKIHRGLN